MEKQQFNLKIDLKELPRKTCDCGSTTFAPCVELGYITALQSPQGKAGFLAIQQGIYLCVTCGKPADLSLPQEKDNVIDLPFSKRNGG
jgi:hypothetical protein